MKRAISHLTFLVLTSLTLGCCDRQVLSQLEELTTDLDNSGLSQQLTLFNNSLHELSAQPGDSSLRDFVVLQGDTLAQRVQRIRQDALERRELQEVLGPSGQLVEPLAVHRHRVELGEGGGEVH